MQERRGVKATPPKRREKKAAPPKGRKGLICFRLTELFLVTLYLLTLHQVTKGERQHLPKGRGGESSTTHKGEGQCKQHPQEGGEREQHHPDGARRRQHNPRGKSSTTPIKDGNATTPRAAPPKMVRGRKQHPKGEGRLSSHSTLI